MHSGVRERCRQFGFRWFPTQNLYLMAGSCDPSGGLLNFGTQQLDTNYLPGNRANYTIPMVEDTSVLAGDQSWYWAELSLESPQCLCVTVFVQEGALPDEADQVAGSGSLGC